MGITDAEVAVGYEAAIASINQAVPAWERGMIPDDAIRQLVSDIVAAVDKLRTEVAAQGGGSTT